MRIPNRVRNPILAGKKLFSHLRIGLTSKCTDYPCRCCIFLLKSVL